MSRPLMNATQAAEELGISRSQFHRDLKRGYYRNLIAREAHGQRRFIPEAIDRLNQGESNTRLVHRRIA